MTASVVGLDMGSSGLRAVQVHRHRRTQELEIVRAASVELPHGAFRNGQVADSKAVVRALRALWRAGRFSTRKVAFALNDSGVLTRQVDLPWMPPADFSAALRYQIGDALPVDLATVELDYHLLGEVDHLDELGNPNPTNRILIVAANREAVAAQARALRAARLEPVRADSAAFALIRALCAGTIPADPTTRAIVDVGADQLTVVIERGGQPAFIRTIANLGGSTATQALADRLDLDWEAAERVKRDTGLNGPAPVVAPIAESSVFGSGAPVAPPDPRVLATIGTLNPWATTIVDEIRNSLDYYQASHPGQPISSVHLTGRTILLDGVIDRIATQFPLPVRVFDPLAQVRSSTRVRKRSFSDARLTVAIGMALAVSP